jgi:hypothetical protein
MFGAVPKTSDFGAKVKPRIAAWLAIFLNSPGKIATCANVTDV